MKINPEPVRLLPVIVLGRAQSFTALSCVCMVVWYDSHSNVLLSHRYVCVCVCVLSVSCCAVCVVCVVVTSDCICPYVNATIQHKSIWMAVHLIMSNPH